VQSIGKISCVLIASVLCAGHTTPAHAGGKSSALAKQLVGQWKVVRWIKKDKEGKPPPEVSVTMHFKKDHSWTGEMKLRGKSMSKQQGSWKLKGNTLITTSPKGPDTMTIAIKGNSLELTKGAGSDKLILQRI
jgi:hypothetical protein